MAIINIRESLLALDKKTSGKYELTTLYEACKLDEKDKEQLVKYIDTKEPPFMIGQFLTDKCGSCLGEAVEDDATEAEKLKFIDDINDGEDHSLWALMDEADEKDNKLTEATLEGTDCNNSKQVRTYLYDKIRKFDEFTDDNSRYWDLDLAISEGDDAVLIPDGSKAPKSAKYMFSFVNEDINIDVFLDRTSDNDTWYVVDNHVISEETELTEDYDVVTMNDKYFPRVDINDTARYDYVQYKGRDFAYDKKDNVLHLLFKDEEEIEVVGGIDKTPFRSLDSAGLSADSWNDTEERDYYLDQYASDIDAETSYLVQDFIQNELPYYKEQGLVDSLDTDKIEELEEATATAERPLSALSGTLSSVLLAHKDEVDTLFTAKDAIEFLDRIRPEVKNVGYVDKVKADIMRKRGIIPVQYFYNIILKGDGEGTDKGGAVSKKSQIKKWAAQPAMESVEDDTDKPYTYRQVFDELKLETKNFTVEGGAGKYGYESEANHAVKILEKHYASVELDKVGSWFQVEFKDRLKEVDESVNPSDLTDCPECGDTSFDSKSGKCTKCSYKEELVESYRGDELTELLDWLQTYNDGALWDSFVVKFEDIEDDMLDPEDILSWLESYDEEAYGDLMSSELYESKYIKESFPRNIDLDQVVIQVANLIDDKALGNDWIEVFPTRDASQSAGGEYFIPLEITGPEDITKKATLRTRNGRVEVAFLNGSEAICDSAEEIARFIAGGFGLTLNESVVEMTADEMKDKFGTDNPDYLYDIDDFAGDIVDEDVKQLIERHKHTYDDIEKLIPIVMKTMNNLSGITPNPGVGVNLTRRKEGPVISATYGFRSKDAFSKDPENHIVLQNISNAEAFKNATGTEVDFEAYASDSVEDFIRNSIKDAIPDYPVKVTTSASGLRGLELSIDVKVII